MSTRSELASAIGKGEAELHAILNSLGVSFQASGRDTYVRVWGRFDKHLWPVRLYPDALVDDSAFGSGVILVQGGIHATCKHARLGGTDDRNRAMYEGLGLWVEEFAPSQAKSPAEVRAALERHRVTRDEYGGEC
ncbi:MAG: hypothetical protein KGO96_13170 [Elusimicrobia bacterium]|nr:hypothetical protein [Elusimicrobiota bacterium]